MRLLDITNWKRKEQFNFFKEYDIPFFNICAEVNVSKLYRYTKENKLSFFISSLFLSIKTANDIEEFRYRIKDDKVIIYDKINCGSTVLNDNETFSFCYFKYFDDFSSFNKNAINVLESNKDNGGKLHPHKGQDDMIHYSVIPWIKFTSFKHAVKLDKNNSIPKIVLGKFEGKREELKMPVSVEVHHSLMDGLHVGKYFELFQKYLNEPHLYL
ncbi:MAG TPA: chloramphenicol acetyltransferase [Ignavibacteria bacterium]|nr:chloramphenicol acetyltransferase [Ignavibacteria bacterium]